MHEAVTTPGINDCVICGSNLASPEIWRVLVSRLLMEISTNVATVS